MPRHLHLDFETFSEADLKAVGAFRYANDPSTEILCAAMALDDGEPIIWRSPSLNLGNILYIDKVWGFFGMLQDPSVLIYCHNAQFEMAICIALLEKTWGIPCPDLSRFRCTMSLARRASLPAKLETLMEALGSPVKKDARGKALIKKFSMMQPEKKPTKALPNGLPVRRIRPEDEPEAFAEFCAYCAQDVRAEQDVSRRLAYFDEPINNANYSLDAVINARGVPVNLVALRHAQKLIEEETEIVSAKFRELVGFEVTQTAAILEWAKKFNYPHDNLQVQTVDEFLENTYAVDENGTKVIEALRLRASISYAAIKKVAKMIECVGQHDNRIRGLLSHHGATTGRWTSSLIQIQNFKRSTIKYSEEAYRDICNGISREMLEVCYGPVLEVISSCIRHFIHDYTEEVSDDY